METAPEQTKEIRRRLEAPDPDLAIEPLPTGRSVKEIKQRLTKYGPIPPRWKLSSVSWSRSSQPGRSIPPGCVTASPRPKVSSNGATPRTTRRSPRMTHRSSPRPAAGQARRRELRAELHMLEQDLLIHAVRAAMLEAPRDAATREMALLRTRQRRLEDQLDQHRHQDVEQARGAAEAAQREPAEKHPFPEALAARNAQLTGELSELTAALDGIHTRQA